MMPVTFHQHKKCYGHMILTRFHEQLTTAKGCRHSRITVVASESPSLRGIVIKSAFVKNNDLLSCFVVVFCLQVQQDLIYIAQTNFDGTLG